ncbi:MAG: hypothetical protein QG654_161 [Patescibacteria group bacterium]|nr:hypothetical protein [Patescibacteria group bacterium]
MTNVLQTRSLLEEAFFQFQRENFSKTISKIVALNIFSFAIFFPLETVVFGYFYEMTVVESLQVRFVAFILNTLTCIYWSRIEIFFKDKMSDLKGISSRWLRNKVQNLWEEASLITVKLIVNLLSYVVVAIIVGKFGSYEKLSIKIGVIVLISYLGADFLKYKMTPFFERMIFGEKEPVDPIFIIQNTSHTLEPLSEDCEKEVFEKA